MAKGLRLFPVDGGELELLLAQEIGLRERRMEHDVAEERQ